MKHTLVSYSAGLMSPLRGRKKNTQLVYCIKFCTEYFIRVLKLVSKYISTPRFAHSCLTGSEKKRETLIGCTNFYSFGIIDTDELVSNLTIDKYYWPRLRKEWWFQLATYDFCLECSPNMNGPSKLYAYISSKQFFGLKSSFE